MEDGEEDSSDDEEGDQDELDDGEENAEDSDRDEIIAGECQEEESEERVMGAGEGHQGRDHGGRSEGHSQSIYSEMSHKYGESGTEEESGGLGREEDGPGEMVEAQRYRAE
jgi:hypothetical protein